MKIVQKSRWILQDGQPILELTIAGETVYRSSEAKPVLLEAGILTLGAVPDAVAARLEPVEFQGQRVENASRDPELLRLFLEFRSALDQGTFEPEEVIRTPIREFRQAAQPPGRPTIQRAYEGRER